MVVLPIWYTNATIVLSPPSRPPTGQMVSEIMDQFRIKSIFCPPIIAEQLVQEPGGLEKCASLNFILYAGGPLSQSAGDALSRVTDVCQFYGSTEVGAIQALVPRREDWASLEWHPKYEAIMEPAMDGSFELILYRNPALEKVRVLSCNFPDEEAWRTKDLFRPHTTKPGLWRFHGRADDIIVLSNGEKFNPVPSETQISSHPLLDGALIIGNGHPQASLILEPKDDPSDPDALIEEIWETVEKANAEAPGHGRITRKMILVGSKDTAFDRSPKGTVVRKSTGEKYDQLVAKLYEAGISNNSQHISLASVDDAASIKRFVKAVVASAFHGGSPGDEDDFFELGLDSLQTTEIISLLKGGIASGGRGHDASWITAKFIYDHPSITSLTEGLRSRFTKADDDSSANISVAEQRQSNMESMVRKYTKFLPNLKTPQVEAQSGYHVLLTGSTGSLGTQLLVALASNPSISHITCLDRSADAHQRIKQSLSTWSPAPVLDPSRISFHPVDYSKPDFALSPSTLAYLSATATLIIHNAWKVDFNHSLASFQSVHLRGVQNLINFSIASTLRPRIIFVSSISSIGNWTAIHNHHTTPVVIPETNAETPAVAQPIGYAESKAVAEQVFSVAATSQGVQSTILRVGQIAGPIGEVNGGKWNEHEWFPLLLKTSKALEKIPDATALGDLDWLPVDVLASAIVDIAFSQIKDVLQVYHLVNPSTRPWADMLPVVRAHLGNPTEVSMREWVTELERLDVHDAEVVAKYPAVKILDFFRDMERYFGASGTRYSTAHAQKCSPRLGNLGPVRAEWVRQWMEHWGF
jgi:thioester reductase-like protein